MSQIQNIIRTQFQAHGGNVVATMNQMAMQTGRFGQSISQTSRMSERLNGQWRAIGTTVRYALAGAAVFGGLRQVSQLRELQRQVGLISALSNSTAQTVVGNQQLVRASAIDAVTPINEFNEGLINFYSSVQNPPDASQVTKILEQISLTAQLAQTEVPEASKAITGMLNIFRQTPNLENVQKYTRMLSDLIMSVPGGAEAGRQIMQQFPVIAAPLAMAGGTPAQTFGLFETLLRAGGTPATHGRGLAFMLQTIGNLGNQPTDVQKAFQSIGVTPDVVSREGIVRALMVAMRAVRARGLNQRGNSLRTLTDDQLDDLGGDAAAQGQNLGISGQGAELAGHLFHRVHALRAFALLTTRTDVMQRDLDSMANDFNGTAQSVASYRKNMKRLTDPQILQQTAIAWQGFQQQLQLAMAPAANLVGRGIIRAEQFTNEHPHQTRQMLVGGAAFLSALTVGKFLGAGRWPGLNRIPGLRSVLGGGGQAFIRANAATAALSGGAGVLGGSPQNPMYVVVVEDLFQGSRNAPGGGGVGGGTVAEAGAGALLARKLLGRGAGFLGRNAMRLGGRFGAFGMQGDEAFLARAARLTPAMIGAEIGNRIYHPEITNTNDWARNLEMLRKRFPATYGYDNVAVGRFQGHGEVWLDLHYTGPGGVQKTKRVHIKQSEFSGGPAPSNKARQGSNR
jgi:hypothetical protein